MAVQRTLSIIKPDAVAKHAVGRIIARLEEEKLNPVAIEMMHLDREKAEGFYHVHKERPFFNDLVTFMTEGPIVVMALEGDDAIQRYRDVMGATDSTKAAEGTIRHAFGTDIERNAVHGSDAPETAAFEIGYFFPNLK